METIKVPRLISEDEQTKEIVNILLCGDSCETSVDMSDLKTKPGTGWDYSLYVEVPIQCDEVCDLFGGPTSTKEQILTSLRFGWYKIRNLWRKTLKKIGITFWDWTTETKTTKIEVTTLTRERCISVQLFGKRYFSPSWTVIKQTESPRIKIF